MNTKHAAIDLFAGCGGLSLGLKLAGFRVVAAVEVDPKAATTYRLNHPESLLLETDIALVDPAKLMKELGIAPGQLDLLAACPPCQGFSRIRTRNGARSSRDPRNSLAMKFAEFAVAMRPRWLLLENVPGLAKHSVWRSLRQQLRRAGYKLHDDIVDASDYGVPQRRKRLILLGQQGSSPALPDRSSRKKTVREAFDELPTGFLDPLHGLRSTRAAHVEEIIRAIPKNGGSRQSLPSHLQLRCHRESNGFADVYGRMRLDDVAPTITSGCHNPSKGRFLHPVEDRVITLREAALLQGFPLDYQFDVRHGRESIALMIGNALPPPMIAAHALAFLQGSGSYPASVG